MNFGGCAVVISHDRWFPDRIATHILAFEGDSQATWFEGNYQAYAEWRREQLGDKAGPHRVRYRSLEGLGGPVLLLVAAGTRAR